MNFEQVLLVILLGSLGIGLLGILQGFRLYLKTPEEQRNPKVETSRKYKLLIMMIWLTMAALEIFIWYSGE